MRMQPGLRPRTRKESGNYRDYCIKNLLGIVFKSFYFLHLVILGTVSKENSFIPSERAQEVEFGFRRCYQILRPCRAQVYAVGGGSRVLKPEQEAAAKPEGGAPVEGALLGAHHRLLPATMVVPGTNGRPPEAGWPLGERTRSCWKRLSGLSGVARIPWVPTLVACMTVRPSHTCDHHVVSVRCVLQCLPPEPHPSG